MIHGIVAGRRFDAAAGAGEELFGQVSSLLHFNAADGSTTFTDVKGITWTRNGNAQIDTAQFVFGDSSLLLTAGTSDWLNATSANFAFGTSDFTIEGWVRYDTRSGNNFMFTFGGGWGVYTFSNQWAVFDGSASNVISGGTVVDDTWYHVALCRRGTSLRLFVDGVLIGSATDSTNHTNQNIRIGAQPSGSGLMTGWVDDFRVTNHARYVSAFTAPTAQFLDAFGDPSFASVVSLIHWNGTNGSTTYTDQIGSTTWANSGTGPVLQTADFKFSTASLKFNGASGIVVDSNSHSGLAMGTNDFTIELWFKSASVSGNLMLYDQRTSLNEPRPLFFIQSGALVYFVNGFVQINGGALTANTWQHIAVSRVSGSTRMFIDGVQTGSTWTDSTNYTQSRIRLGGAGDSASFGNHSGAYDDLRVTNGVGRYPGNFSPLPVAFPDSL